MTDELKQQGGILASESFFYENLINVLELNNFRFFVMADGYGHVGYIRAEN